MADQDSKLTCPPAEKQPAPSRADEVSNVRVLYIPELKRSYLVFFISDIGVMINKRCSYLTLYKIF